MTVKVQLSAVGINTTLFDIYSNFNNVTPIASGISKMALLAGYYLSPVPDGATTIRVVATGTCTNYTDMPISGLTTTTTTTATPTTTTSTTGTPTTTTTSSSTSTTSSSSTTTTTAAPTTTTTTTAQVFTQGLDQSSAYCVGGFCELDGTITGITVYSLDEVLVTGSFIYTDPALTIPYTTNLVSDGQYIFNVSGLGELTITCTVGIEC
jgi:hypothetical protein